MKTFAVFFMLAIAMTQTAMAQTDLTPINLTSPQQSADIVFPEPSKTYLKDIPRFDVATLKHIGKGIHSDTVRQLLGNPHFNEFASSQWNYLLAVANPEGQNYTQCQLQIHFDDKKYVSDYYWSSQACANLVNATTAIDNNAIANNVIAKNAIAKNDAIADRDITISSVAKAEPKPFTLRSDILFGFDSS